MALIVVAVFGFMWEFFTPELAKLPRLAWAHPFGDTVDFAAFVLGAATTFVALTYPNLHP